MKKMNKKAFTLIELLIVIAIIGILFIVLVSKVDFATDKAKATGVQTDFRSFQVAFEQVAKENSGFNTFGWDEGDKSKDELWSGKKTPDGQDYTYANKAKDAGDRVRNSYDAGDANLNGEMESTETWVGRKIYTEEWTGVYTLVNPGKTDDMSAVAALERAINANLDPKLHISIADRDAKGQYKITMANQAQDPWKSEYEGAYLTNASAGSTTNKSKDATVDGLDRGAIIMYSKGANLELGCVEEVLNGEVVVTVLQADKEATTVAGTSDHNKAGADDYSIATIYTYKNGYGEIISTTTGFSNNQ
jgi:prepilin-type N-terminal cleavage/methylation domain-containing protein